MASQSVKMTDKLIVCVAQHEVRESKYPKTLGNLTRLGGSKNRDILKWTDMKAAAEEEI